VLDAQAVVAYRDVQPTSVHFHLINPHRVHAFVFINIIAAAPLPFLVVVLSITLAVQEKKLGVVTS